jgi:hypothetical protein
MNVLEGLRTIRERLVDNEAEAATITLVDGIIRRAATPSAAPANAQSLLQLTRMLMRSPVASANTRVYNDLVRLEDELQQGAAAYRQRVAEEEAKPVPKTKKYYKELKEREKKSGTG